MRWSAFARGYGRMAALTVPVALGLFLSLTTGTARDENSPLPIGLASAESRFGAYLPLPEPLDLSLITRDLADGAAADDADAAVPGWSIAIAFNDLHGVDLTAAHLDPALAFSALETGQRAFEVPVALPRHRQFLELRTLEGATASPGQAATLPASGNAGLFLGTTSVQRPSTDGSTPGLAKAIRLASTTPTQTPAGMRLLSPSRLAARLMPGTQARIVPVVPGPLPSRYAALVSPRTLEREMRCLAEAVYFEARSEPESGQAAVAQVVLNRAQSGVYPASICGVVYQNRHRYLACQFTFACEGKSLAIAEPDPWRQAQRIARDVLEGRVYSARVGNATHYHATYVRPWWARKMEKRDKVGSHIFYFEPPGEDG